jgi:dihydroorotate dehydrogenase (fumarate)
MDLSTTYLGLRLPHPFMPGASPLVDDLDTVRRLEDAGAAAIVMHSLFEEQLETEQVATSVFLDSPADSFAEALDYFPEPDDFALGPQEYLQQVSKIKKMVDIPVIASLNGSREGMLLDYARLIEEAGADALELNLYLLATHPLEDGSTIEQRLLAMVEDVKKSVSIPLAVKLSPYFTALANFVRRLEEIGADGVVIFNRFYQADLDIEELEAERSLHLSDSSELLLRLRWLAVLSSQVEISLAATGGVHTVEDAVKAVMCGAHAVQTVSALLSRGAGGADHLAALRAGLEAWLVDHEYESLEQMRGSMNLANCPDPAAYERANYVQILQSWRDADRRL